MSQLVETYMVEAIKSVFAELGDENIAVLKENLKRDYVIDLATNTFTLEELQIALQRLIGTGGATLLLKKSATKLRYWLCAKLSYYAWEGDSSKRNRVQELLPVLSRPNFPITKERLISQDIINCPMLGWMLAGIAIAGAAAAFAH